MDTEEIKIFIDKFATNKDCADNEAPGVLTDDELEAVSGGSRDMTIAFLESYCKKITILGVQQECYAALDKLRGSTE